MISLQELFHYLECFLPSSGITDVCPNGLQVEGAPQIKKLGLAVTASLAVIESAVKEQVDALIVHHGIFWQKDSLPLIGTKQKKLRLLLTHQISLFAYHFPLDAHRIVGNNWKAAQDLGWQNLQGFGLSSLGVKGEFFPRSVQNFTKELEDYYGHPAVVALGGKNKVSSAAIISGGAYRFIEQAADEHLDCFITGHFDEPAWDMAHERMINFFALGHHATERVGIIALTEYLRQELPVECLFLDLPNPF